MLLRIGKYENYITSSVLQKMQLEMDPEKDRNQTVPKMQNGILGH